MDNKAVNFKSHLNAVCQVSYISAEELRTELLGSCGTELFENNFQRPSYVLGSDWVCQDPFVLQYVGIDTLTDASQVVQCIYDRPFIHSIDVKEMKIGDSIPFISGYNVYENPGSTKKLAQGFSQEMFYTVTDSAAALSAAILGLVLTLTQ